MTQTKHVANAFQIYRRLFRYVRYYLPALIIAGIASMLYSGIDAWFIYFLKPLLNDGLVARNKEFLTYAPLLVLGVFILRGVTSFFSNYYIAAASRGVIMDLRQDLFKHMQRLPAKYYDHTTSGQMLSIILYGVDQVANASADVLTTAIQSIFLIIGLLAVMFSISWKLSLLYFIIIPVVLVVMRVTSLRIRRLSLSVQDSIAELSHRAEENLEGYKVIRAFQGQHYEAKKFADATNKNRQREMKIVTARALSGSTVQLLSAFALALTLYIATLDIANDLLSPGGFVALIAAMISLLKPMKDLAFVQNKLYRGLAGAQQVFEVMDEPTEQDHGQHSIKRATGLIEFSHVSFSYNNESEALHDVSFTVKPGKTIALVGRSGSGKSTLVNLLPRFYELTKGDILLDGKSIRDYRLDDLRKQFAIVSQHITLFHDTVFNNIAYPNNHHASMADVKEAARMAMALPFIEELPKQFDAIVGENGVLLSGGQRQRIAIARAILKKAPILILDEATASLDTEAEHHIQTALEHLMQSCTTIVIAHRLSTVEKADRILVLDKGRIIEDGTHESLLAANGQYTKLYRMQFKETELVMA